MESEMLPICQVFRTVQLGKEHPHGSVRHNDKE
jgi:hypothetical protein